MRIVRLTTLGILLIVLLSSLTACWSTAEPGFSIITDENQNTAHIDPLTGDIITISEPHEEMHEGRFFFVKGFTSVTGALTNYDLLGVTPASGGYAHMDMSFTGEAEYQAYLYEGVTTSADGSALAIYNANRVSANVALTTAYTGPTLAGGALGDTGQGGTLIWSTTFGTATGAQGTSGFNRGGDYELLLKANTKYWLRFTHVPAGTHWLDYDIYWYEHP